MSIIERARDELKRINFGEEDSRVMIDLLQKFLNQWDSGGAVSVAGPVFTRLLSGQPLSPLTGADDEWHDPMNDGIMLQNVRCSSVFKTWRNPDTRGMSNRAGEGIRTVEDINNEGWDGTFPYDPQTRLPGHPVMVVEISGAGG